MGRWREQTWESLGFGPSTRDRRSGSFRSFSPDLLVARPLVIDDELSLAIGTAERALHRLATHENASSMAGMSRFLLRSEAIASSRIEGVAPSVKQIAIADLDDVAARSRATSTAHLVANNIAIVKQASQSLAEADSVTVEDITALQRALLPTAGTHGLRTAQNWIGVSEFTPIGAEFVPPHPDEVPALMDDLARYTTASPHAPLIHAALVHAQFETIHPFGDGNGRVGRALVHTVLERRGVTAGSVLPISAVLATLSREYVTGLTQYRYTGDPISEAGIAGTAAWLRVFAHAVVQAVEIVQATSDVLAEIRARWMAAVVEARVKTGGRAPRSDSATVRLLRLLPEVPAVTAATVTQLLAVSPPAARAAIEELSAVGILAPVSIGRGSRAHLALDVLELLDLTERRMASTRFDTREAPPSRPAPALARRS